MISGYFEGLFESILIASVFYFAYALFFSKEASFNQNRVLLLSGVLLSLIFPFLEFTGPQNVQFQVLVELKTIEVLGTANTEYGGVNPFTWFDIFCAIYISGVFFFFISFIRQIIRISGFYRNSKIQVENSVKYVYTGKRHPVFSFMNMVFIDSESEKSSGLDAIIKHESVHVVQKHSIDLLLFELLAIVQWFNPIIWVYRKTIKQNHEFLADNGVLKNGFPMDNYQELLLQNYSALNFWLANSFNHSLTFKRLIMMKKNSSNKKSLVKLIAIIPILLVSVYFISCSKDDQDLDQTNESKENVVVIDESGNEVVVVADKIATLDPSEKVYKIVEEMPVYPGGDVELRKFIAQNVRYPEEAKKNGVSGKVYVRFVVDSNGSIGDVTIARGASPLLDAEAMRVVKLMSPIWTPGKQKGKAVSVWLTVPINFSLH